jgi:hypothetical protein
VRHARDGKLEFKRVGPSAFTLLGFSRSPFPGPTFARDVRREAREAAFRRFPTPSTHAAGRSVRPCPYGSTSRSLRSARAGPTCIAYRPARGTTQKERPRCPGIVPGRCVDAIRRARREPHPRLTAAPARPENLLSDRQRDDVRACRESRDASPELLIETIPTRGQGRERALPSSCGGGSASGWFRPRFRF